MKILLVFFAVFPQVIFSQNLEFDHLQKQFDQETNAPKKLEILNEMAQLTFDFDLKKALELSRKGVLIAENSNNKEWLPKFLEMQGRMHANLLELDSAVFYFNKAIENYKIANNQEGQASTLFKLAWVDKKKGNYEKALEKDLSALKIMESINNPRGICDALTRVSEDLTRQNRLKEALVYAEKAIKIAEQNNLEKEKYFVNFNAGNVAIAMEKYPESLKYYNKTLEIVYELDLGFLSETDILNSRGNAYKKLEKYDLAVKDYEKALSIATTINYKPGISSTIANLGEVNLLAGNHQEALKYQLKTVELQEENNDNSNLVENYNHLSNIYQKLGDYQNALSYKQKAYSLQAFITTEQSNAKMAEMLTKYETEKKEETIAIQKDKLSQQAKIQGLGIGIGALLIGFLVFGFFSWRDRAKKNELLTAKNQENELLLKEIHHRVKNNLEIVSSLLALQSAQIDDPQTREAMQESQNRVNSIGIVHQNLYQGTNLGSIEMKGYLLNLSENILDSFGVEEKIQLELAMEKLELDIDTAVPLGLIINELITNTIKYAFPDSDKGIITIKMEKQAQNMLRLEVSDNGIGKSSEIQGTGFGSQLVTLLTQQLNGTMTETIHNGTTIQLDFKLKKSA